jgi:O-antigen/teichoic acid export membrane protein
MSFPDGKHTAAAGTVEGSSTKGDSRHTFVALFKLLSGDFLNKGILIAINILLIRGMQSAQFAVFVTMFAMVQFSYQAACGVIERLYIAEHESFGYRGRTTLNVLMVIASILIVGYFAIFGEWLLALFTTISSYALASFQLSRIRLQKEERYGAFVAIDSIRILITFLLLLPVLMVSDVLADFQAFTIIAVFTIGALSADVIARSLITATKYTELRNYGAVIRLLMERFSLLAYSLIGAIFPFVTLFLANTVSNANVVADYGVALRYQSILSMLAVATNVYTLPRLSNVDSLDEAIEEIRRFIKYIPHVIAVVFLYIGIVWMIMPILNGPTYDNSRPIFALLGLCALSSLVATPFTNLLVRQEMYHSILLSMMAGLLITVLLSLLLIHALDYLAFAAGSLAGYVVVNGLITTRGVYVMRDTRKVKIIPFEQSD